MSGDDWLDDEIPKPKPRKKTRGKAHLLDDPIDDEFDAMLESVSKTAPTAVSSKKKSSRKSTTDTANGWSKDAISDEDERDKTNAPPILRRNSRRAAEEIVAKDIPTILMDEADADDTTIMKTQVAVAPVFSANQVASFKEIEKEFYRQRTSKYINAKIDIGILYYNLHLQEDLDAEEQKKWDWDKTFVEIRNSITNSTTEP